MESTEGQEEFRWKHELARRDAERAHDQTDKLHENALSNALTTANSAIRFTVVINGGAAVSILAFIGALVSKVDLDSIRNLASTLVWFAYGIVSCGVAYSAAYIALMSATRHFTKYSKSWSHPWAQPKHYVWHYVSTSFEVIAMIATVCSLAMFVIGVLDVRNAINSVAVAH
jgi:hypothetical protein